MNYCQDIIVWNEICQYLHLNTRIKLTNTSQFFQQLNEYVYQLEYVYSPNIFNIFPNVQKLIISTDECIDCSFLVNLTHLNCSNCSNIFNVEKLVNLTHLECYNCPNITGLDKLVDCAIYK